MGRTYCDEEGRAFDDAEFADADGATIHVLSPTRGHTTEGWPASFTGSKDDGSWVVEEVTVKHPPLNVADGNIVADGSIVGDDRD